jgi:hypothetical protein
MDTPRPSRALKRLVMLERTQRVLRREVEELRAHADLTDVRLKVMREILRADPHLAVLATRAGLT